MAAHPSQERKFFGTSMQTGYYESIDGFPGDGVGMGGMYMEAGGLYPPGQMGDLYMEASMRRAYPPHKLVSLSSPLLSSPRPPPYSSPPHVSSPSPFLAHSRCAPSLFPSPPPCSPLP
eukprot:764497-Hanusia_phi.AAC.1